MIMTKRLDTGSPWPLNNGGHGPYAAQDGALHLTQVIRASTAAPTYFAPEEIAIHRRNGSVVDGAFVDGGVTPFNDPALQLLMLATLQGHGFLLADGQGSPADRLDRHGRVQAAPLRRRRRRRCGRQAGHCRAAVAHGRLRADQSCDPAMADKLSDALDHRSGGRRHEARQPRRTSARDLCPLQRDFGAGLAERPSSASISSADKLEQLRKMDDPSNLSSLADLGRLAAAKQSQARTSAGAFDLATASV